MANSADPDQSAQKPTDLDLHCLQRQDISGFSRTRANKKKTSLGFYSICECFSGVYTSIKFTKIKSIPVVHSFTKMKIVRHPTTMKIMSFITQPTKHF